jgi:hypothetical protein
LQHGNAPNLTSKTDLNNETVANSIKQGVCHTVALPFTLKRYLKAKEEIGKLIYLTMQKYNLQNNPPKETKILQDIITL